MQEAACEGPWRGGERQRPASRPRLEAEDTGCRRIGRAQGRRLEGEREQGNEVEGGCSGAAPRKEIEGEKEERCGREDEVGGGAG